MIIFSFWLSTTWLFGGESQHQGIDENQVEKCVDSNCCTLCLRKNCTPNQNWAWVVCYLKIINTLTLFFFFEYNIYTLKQMVWEIQNGIEISVGNAVLGFLINMRKLSFWSISQEPLGLIKFYCHFWVSHKIGFRMLISFVFSSFNCFQ